MLAEVLGGFVLAMLLWSAHLALAPTHTRCHPGYYVNGVTPQGAYRCRQIPRLQRAEESPPHWKPADDLPGEGREYGGNVYCTGGTHPIVVNWETIGCQP